MDVGGHGEECTGDHSARQSFVIWQGLSDRDTMRYQLLNIPRVPIVSGINACYCWHGRSTHMVPVSTAFQIARWLSQSMVGVFVPLSQYSKSDAALPGGGVHVSTDVRS
jgi:hypothetical protein